MTVAPTTSGGSPAGLWTEPGSSYTVVLAHVRSCFFAKAHNLDSDHELNDTDNVSWDDCLPEKSKYFIIKFTGSPPGDSGMWWTGKRHREIGLDFLRALALYWETRT